MERISFNERNVWAYVHGNLGGIAGKGIPATGLDFELTIGIKAAMILTSYLAKSLPIAQGFGRDIAKKLHY